MHIFAPCPRGLEELLVSEFNTFGLTQVEQVGGGVRASSAAMRLEGGARSRGPCPGVGWRSRREGLRGRVCFVCQLPKERERSGPVGQRAAVCLPVSALAVIALIWLWL